MTCALCYHSSFTPLFSFPNPRPVGARHFSYLKCQNCSLVSLSPPPPSRVLSSIYADPQYFSRLCQPVASPLLHLLLSIRFFPEYDEYVTSYSRPGRLLDVGCGNGEFLQIMAQKGWSVAGIDPSSVAITNAKKRLPSADLRIGQLTPKSFTAKFDVITMWHVLEHVPHPLQFFQAASSLLSRRGRLFLEVPNADSLLLSWFGSAYNWLMVPEHIHYYSKASLSFLSQAVGLEVIRFDCPPRALLNFSLSLKKRFGPLAFWPSLPFSLPVALAAKLLGRSEVVRLVAGK